jgi:hypothetical protein
LQNKSHADSQKWNLTYAPYSAKKRKRPPGNRVASSLGRIVPTEAKPSELSGEILVLVKTGVKT